MKKVLLKVRTLIMTALAVVLPMFLLLQGVPAEAADSGWRSPSANAIDNYGFTTTPTYAYGDGGLAARTDQDFFQPKDISHQYYNYSFNIPTGATIDGIELRIDGWGGSMYMTHRWKAELSWDGGTSWTSTKTTPDHTDTSEYTETLGGSTDTWGRTWSNGEFSNANFRLRIHANANSGFYLYYYGMFCEWVPIKVYYTINPTWESYQTSARTTVWGTSEHPYDSDNHVAYMKGVGFACSHSYKIGYYDADGNKVATENQPSSTDGVLTGAYDLMTHGSAAAGTWHSVVFDTIGTIPNTYAEALTDPNYVVDDDFVVAQSAIPEFPSVIAGLGVPGLCIGIYYWMRKRRLTP
jgi:hypothetical protein